MKASFGVIFLLVEAFCHAEFEVYRCQGNLWSFEKKFHQWLLLDIKNISMLKSKCNEGLTREIKDGLEFDELQLMNAIKIQVKELHGLYGLSVAIDLLKYDGNIAYFRVNNEYFSLISSTVCFLTALPLITSYAGAKCRLLVLAQSCFLVALS